MHVEGRRKWRELRPERWPHKRLPRLLSTRNREWFTGSGGAPVKFISRRWSPWCGGGERTFLQLVKHFWSEFSPSASPPKSVHLHDKAKVLHSPPWPSTCVRLCGRFTKEACAVYLTAFVFRVPIWCWWKKNVRMLLLREFCVEPWVNFKGPLTDCVLRVTYYFFPVCGIAVTKVLLGWQWIWGCVF